MLVLEQREEAVVTEEWNERKILAGTKLKKDSGEARQGAR